MPDERVDLAQREGRRWPAVEVALQEAVGGPPRSSAAVAACSTTVGPCFLARARTPRMRRTPAAPSCGGVVAEGGDRRAGPLGGRQQGKGLQRGAGRAGPGRRSDAGPASRAVLAEEWPVRGSSRRT